MQLASEKKEPFVPYDIKELKSIPYQTLLNRLPLYTVPEIPGWLLFSSYSFTNQSEFEILIEHLASMDIGFMANRHNGASDKLVVFQKTNGN